MLRIRTVLQSSVDLMAQAERLYLEQKKILDEQRPKHEALMSKLREAYKARGLELQYDLTLKPVAKPVEAKK